MSHHLIINNLREDATWYIEFWSIDEIDVLEQPERSHSDMFRWSESRSENNFRIKCYNENKIVKIYTNITELV